MTSWSVIYTPYGLCKRDYVTHAGNGVHLSREYPLVSLTNEVSRHGTLYGYYTLDIVYGNQLVL